VDDSLARFRCEFPGDHVYHLFPLRKRYVRRLLHEVDFQRITT
jgi:glycine/sarcosine N-methyltransferase